jgi:hypothetical protein
MQIVSNRQRFIVEKIRANTRALSAMEEEVAFVKFKRNSWGEIDYEYYKKLKEERQEKLQKED